MDRYLFGFCLFEGEEFRDLCSSSWDLGSMSSLAELV